ncbi:MAG: FAD synthase [Methanophagales archaeon]|nr:FAD synthase [Methanophagales archaeon]
MVRVLATGTFELLHPGHLLFLEEAKRLGDELFVIIGRDVNVKKQKRTPIIPEEQRLKMVSALRMVDKAMLGSEKDMYDPLYSIKPDIVAIGYDQDFDEDKLERGLRERGFQSKVIRIKKQNSNAFCKVEEIIRLMSELKLKSGSELESEPGEE